MIKSEHLSHAKHNEQACQYINGNGSLNDWVITTSFYSALHYVSYRIFPFDMTESGNRKVQIRNLEFYHRHYQTAATKHLCLNDLVYENCPEIYSSYEWLYSTCMTARYHDYNQSKRMSDLAIQYLLEIRDYCVE